MAVTTQPDASAGARRGRGRLRVYLGAAPGVGKTYAMLDEGWRRKERGTDIVVGLVETHDRPRTIAQLRDLEVIPRKLVPYKGTTFTEMDLDAVLARKPSVVLVDELAHTNVPGGKHEKRWQDIDELLDAGIDVISTVNIQHLESLNDVTERITGVRQRETVPDDVVRRADQIELVDMSPESLRRRMAHGNIYPPERVDAALANYFRPGNLSALRELALLWLADRVEENLQSYMEAHGISDAWETRERVVVAVTGAPGGERLVRRAARIAGRLRGELLGVRVVAGDGLASRPGPELEAQRTLLKQLGGTYREVTGDDVATALVGFARAEKATQLVIGATRRSRWQELLRGSVVQNVTRAAEGFDVHVIATTSEAGAELVLPSRAPAPAARSRPRVLAAVLLLVLGIPVLTAVLVPFRSDLALPTDFLLFLTLSVLIAALGGVTLGVAAALLSTIVLNWFFVPPVHTLTISQPENVVALVVFVSASVAIAVLVTALAAKTREALQARSEAEVLARTSATLIAEPDPLPILLEQLRLAFRLDAVALLSNRDDGWVSDASAGSDPPREPHDGERFDLTDDGTAVLVLRGPQLTPDDQRVLRSFISNLSLAVRSRRLQAEAATAERLAQANELRTALLQAVSHDLRTPLASIKASATSLLEPDVHWDEAHEREFLETIDLEVDRMNRLVGNLLDMSRIQAGGVQIAIRPSFVDDIVAAALGTVDHDPARVAVDVPDSLPAASVDPALVERAVANVVANALAWSPPGQPVRIEAQQVGPRLHLRIVDRGPGVAPADRERVFQPFQRLGDRGHAGVGLGLAVARGFTRAVGGELTLDDTPGGGLTALLDLPIAGGNGS